MLCKLDENLPVQAAHILQEAGHDVSTVLSQGMGGATDAEVIEAVTREGRVLVTLDLDFADIRAYPPYELPGIIVLRVKRLDREAVLAAVRSLALILKVASPTASLWVLDGARLRIRG